MITEGIDKNWFNLESSIFSLSKKYNNKRDKISFYGFNKLEKEEINQRIEKLLKINEHISVSFN